MTTRDRIGPGDEEGKRFATIHPTAGSGIVRMGEVEVPCFVLADGTAYLTGRGILRIFGGAEGGNLGRFLSRIPGISPEISGGARMQIRLPNNSAIADAFPADVVGDICGAFVRGLAAGAFKPSQMATVGRAMVLTEALLKTSATALIWEATGYDRVKATGALQAKLAVALRPEPGPWDRLYLPEFFDALAGLFRLELDGTGHRPACFGAFLAEFFYEWFDRDVLAEMRRRRAVSGRPMGKGNNHHQHLTDEVRARFKQHQSEVLLLIKSSESVADFRNRFNRIFHGDWLQLSLGMPN